MKLYIDYKMHDTSFASAILVGLVYGKQGNRVLNVGGKYDDNLRNHYKNNGIEYVCLDMDEHPSVDVVNKPGDPFPFADESFDIIISTSCFEHDPCFWMTFRELCRVIKKDGYIYVNAPSNGVYHTYPGDNWRFYSDAGQALAYWSGKEIDRKCWPVKVEETFHILPKNDIWTDFVCIWKRTDSKETAIVISNEIRDKIGPLQQALHDRGFSTKNKF